MLRRAGAPRLIEWTGERCVPWAPDTQVVYEHLHRYMWAAQFVAGRRVLDLASGEGFGAAILADTAERVVGIDIDEQTVEHSRLNYAGERIEFQLGDARDLSRFETDSFDVVIALEMIEHVDDHDRVLREISRVLKADGLLVISTPDRHAYTDAGDGQDNPFHVRELGQEELVALLRSRFAQAAVWGQRTVTGSVLSALDGSDGATPPSASAERPRARAKRPPARSFFIARDGAEWGPAAGLSPMYLVALASNAALPAAAHDSTLADCGLQLLADFERRGAGAALELEHQRDELGEQLSRERHEWELLRAKHAAEVDVARKEAEVAGQQAEFTRRQAEAARKQVDVAQENVHATQRRADIASEKAEAERKEIDKLAARVATLESELDTTRRALARVEGSVTWHLFMSVRTKMFGALGGEGSRRTHAMQRALRIVGRAFLRGGPRPFLATGSDEFAVAFPEFDHPEVSIVIPVYSGAELTKACLHSIRDKTGDTSYEVILIDDTADAATKRLLAKVRGARIVVNPSNLGYLRSINRAASYARGNWLVLCNNDIEVGDGWLSEMLACGESSPDIAAVTPKYLYPDGSLNEAGAILWRDGTGHNYGRGDDPADHKYQFRREVDYGSAAALMVRAEFWRLVGGYDERFAPMYYEDADLCSEARERGLRVLYEPAATVTHLEGGAAGTDIAFGPKRYQEINRPKFTDKWREHLEREQLDSGIGNVRRASNRTTGPHALILDHRVPMCDRDAGSVRMMAMIRVLQELGWRITFFPDNVEATPPYARELHKLGVDVWSWPVDIAAELSAIGPELSLVITCRPQGTSRWLDLLREHAPTVPIVYDTVDLHWLREARRAAIADPERQVTIGPRASVLREIELALVRATDATLVATEEERAQVEADVPDACVRVVPMIHDLKPDVPPAEDRSGVLFVGGFEHPPNTDAALRLVREVMPTVWRELGPVPVKIVGSSPPSELKALASDEVEVTGWVHDLQPLLDQARALVAPLSYGAGMKGKVTQALAAGLPVVTTTIGAEGLARVSGEHMLIADGDDELAQHVIRVIQDPDLWQRLSRSGQQLAAERCSPELLRRRLTELLADLQVAERGPLLARQPT